MSAEAEFIRKGREGTRRSPIPVAADVSLR